MTPINRSRWSATAPQTRQRRPAGGGAGDRSLGGGIDTTIPDHTDVVTELLAFVDWARRRRCGLCGGAGERWSLTERSTVVCLVCRGDGRGSIRVEPGAVSDDAIVAELVAEYVGIMVARGRLRSAR